MQLSVFTSLKYCSKIEQCADSPYLEPFSSTRNPGFPQAFNSSCGLLDGDVLAGLYWSAREACRPSHFSINATRNFTDNFFFWLLFSVFCILVLMKIYLLFPPISDPRGPHLAPAALAAALRKSGCDVILKDLDLEMALYLLAPDNLAEHQRKAEEVLKSLSGRSGEDDWEILAWRQKLSQCIDEAREVISTIPDHLNVLRGEEFYDNAAYFTARRSIDKALALICAVYDRSLQYKMDGQFFATRYKEHRLDELLQAVDDAERNLFGRFYPLAVIPDVVAEKPDLVGISILNFQQVIPGLTLAKQLKR